MLQRGVHLTKFWDNWAVASPDGKAQVELSVGACERTHGIQRASSDS